MEIVTQGLDQWLEAPFLQEIRGDQLFAMMRTIKSRDLSGVMECALDGGRVSVLNFHEGRPAEDKTLLGQLVKRPAIVTAWMPRAAPKTAASEASRLRLDARKRLTAELVELFADYPALRTGRGWALVACRDEIVAASRPWDEIEGLGSLIGLIAQINAAHAQLLADKSLRRATVDFGDLRIGVEHVGGEWSLLYRVPPDVQSLVGLLAQEVGTTLAKAGESLDGAAYAPCSRAVTSIETEYVAVRPDLYREIERTLRLAYADEAPWRRIWFRYGNPIVYNLCRDGDSFQELGGQFAALVHLLRHDLASLTGRTARNFVLHAERSTVWCHLRAGDDFYATSYETAGTVYRSVDRRLTEQGLASLNLHLR